MLPIISVAIHEVIMNDKETEIMMKSICKPDDKTKCDDLEPSCWSEKLMQHHELYKQKLEQMKVINIYYKYVHGYTILTMIN